MDYHTILDKISRNIIYTLNNIPIPKNGVIVYDIDDTLIDSAERPLYSIINTYHHAVFLGLKPVFITARVGTSQNINYTQNLLKKYGLENSLCMYFRPPDNHNPYDFKLSCRKNIHENGYQVIMSIGDMPWDIGEYGGIGIKLPNKI